MPGFGTGDKAAFWGDEELLCLDCGKGSTEYLLIKTHGTGCLKWVGFIIDKLRPQKAEF